MFDQKEQEDEKENGELIFGHSLDSLAFVDSMGSESV